jgi:hypothetical protein
MNTEVDKTNTKWYEIKYRATDLQIQRCLVISTSLLGAI